MVVIVRGGAAGGLRRKCTGNVSRITTTEKGGWPPPNLLSRIRVYLVAIFKSPSPDRSCTRPGQARGGSVVRRYRQERKLVAGAWEQGRRTKVRP